MGEMEELLARAEEATGPDRELDGFIAAWQLGWPLARVWWDGLYVGYHTPGPDHPAQLMDRTDKVPAVTASLDASLALVERVLPGWELELTSEHRDDEVIWRVMLGDPLRGVDGEAPTPALALLAALLRALQVEHG